MIGCSILIAGHVQDAFFSRWIVHRAGELDILGYFRHLNDGRAEVYAVGDEARIGKFVERLRVGSPASRVNVIGTAMKQLGRRRVKAWLQPRAE
jgi:acylphosphatase